MIFEERFRKIVKESGKQQKDIAQEMEVAPSTISKLLKGTAEPSPDVLTKISKIFDVSIDWLLGITESKQVREIRKSECRTLGLSDYAIDVLRKNAWQNRKGFDSKLLRGLNILFEQDKKAQEKDDINQGKSILWNLCKLIDLIYDDYNFTLSSNNEIILSKVERYEASISETSVDKAVIKDYYVSKYIDYIWD